MKSRFFLALLTLFFLSACSGVLEIGIEHPLVTPPVAVDPVVVPPSPTPLVLPATPVDTVAAPTLPAPTDTEVPPAVTAGPQMVQIFLIGMEDNGQSGPLVGCGDSAISVQAQIEPTQGVLRASLEKLLSIKDQYYGQSGLYNALYQSNLQVQSVTISGGAANVQLTGTLQMGGECDNPRVQAQLEDTVLQFPNITRADIFINGKTLAEALSLK